MGIVARSAVCGLIVIWGSTASAEKGGREPWEEKALRDAEAALGGGLFDFERMGVPKRARDAAERIIRRGAPAYRPAALLLEARAAAAGGDYRQARFVLRRLGGSPMSPEQRELADIGEMVWSCLALLAPGGTRPAGQMEPTQKCVETIEKAAQPSGKLAKDLRRRGTAAVVLAGWPATIAGATLEQGQIAQVLEFAKGSAATTGCGVEPSCPLGSVLQARLLVASHQAQTANEIVETALSLAGGDSRLTGLLQMTKGDLLIAHEGAPEELGLPFSTAPYRLARRAGRSRNRPPPPTASDLKNARDRYAEAARLFREGICPRCLVDLQVRDAYLAFLEQRFSVSSDGFEKARLAYSHLGDEAAAARLDFARLALALKVGDQERASRLVKRASADLRSRDSAPRAAAYATWLLRFSSEEREAGNIPVALAASSSARTFGETTAPPDVRREALARNGDFLSELGLHRQAIGDLRLAFDAVPPERSLERTSIAMSLLRDYLALEDVENARLLVEGTCPACTDPNLLMTAHRYDDVVALGHTQGDRLIEAMGRLGKNDFAGAAPLIEAEARLLSARLQHEPSSASEELPSLRALAGRHSPAIDSLRAQLLRGRTSQVFLAAIRGKQFKVASELLSIADRRFSLSVLSEPDEPWSEPADRAVLAAGLGDFRTARELGDRAVTLIDEFANVAASNVAEENLRDSVGYVFVDATRVRIEQALAGQILAEEALAYLENWRARRFYARLQRAAILTSGPATALTTDLRRLTKSEIEIAALRREISGGSARKDQSANRARLEELESQRLATMARPGMPPLATEPVNATTLVAGLHAPHAESRNTAFISYFADRDLVVAWVVSGEGTVTLRRLPTTAFELRDLVTQLRNAVQRNMIEAHDTTWRSVAATLEARLLAPLDNLLPPAGPDSRLGIVPFACLHGLPFHALLRQDTPLVQRYAVFYPPSLRTYPIVRDLARSRRSTGLETRIISFGFNGPWLSDAEREAVALARRTDAHHGSTATRYAFERAAATSSILHISAHAEYDVSDPFASTIWLHGGPMKIFDFATMKINARLLTLSACDTGRSEITRGEDLSGMSWAILATGVPSVVVAGWRVGDERSLPVMRTFYSELREGRDAAVALADAQRSVATKSGPSASWAVFSLMGAD